MPRKHETDKEGTPKLLRHCQSVYDKMYEQSEWDSGYSYIIWEGHLTHVVEELGLGIPRYTRIVTALKGMGCIEQLRRGNSGAESLWHLYHEPDQARFNAWNNQNKTKHPRARASDQRWRDLEARVSALEAHLLEKIGYVEPKFDDEEQEHVDG